MFLPKPGKAVFVATNLAVAATLNGAGSFAKFRFDPALSAPPRSI
jgi:hypothetical protein